MKKALVTATFCGRLGSYQASVMTSTDLPAKDFGELSARILDQAWRAGEDPEGCAITIVFRTIR